MNYIALPYAGETPILIIAQPGRRRASLAAVLKPLSPIQLVDPVADGLATVQARLEAGRCLVLLDAALPGEQSWQWLGWIEQGWPHVPCLLLVEDLQQGQQAQQHGADQVLLKGFAMAELLTTIAAIHASGAHHLNGRVYQE